jgi:RNA polymerase sigma-70 factor, ECF subfamily
MPSPIVELNRAAAVAMRDGPEAGLDLLEAIDGLDDYRPLHAARGELLRRLGRDAEATAAYERALTFRCALCGYRPHKAHRNGLGLGVGRLAVAGRLRAVLGYRLR